jgi:hypothetical protein
MSLLPRIDNCCCSKIKSHRHPVVSDEPPTHTYRSTHRDTHPSLGVSLFHHHGRLYLPRSPTPCFYSPALCMHAATSTYTCLPIYPAFSENGRRSNRQRGSRMCMIDLDTPSSLPSFLPSFLLSHLVFWASHKALVCLPLVSAFVIAFFGPRLHVLMEMRGLVRSSDFRAFGLGAWGCASLVW